MIDSRQNRTLRVFMSVTVGAIAFCLTVPVVLVLGGIVLSWLGLLEGEGLIPTGFAVLFLISVLVGLTVAVFAGIKYYRHMKNSPIQ